MFAEHYARAPFARELVADAALRLVDSVDLTGGHLRRGAEATEYLYHRLLGCGLRLAATAGTDAMLSHSRLALLSNPPGWSRVYANLREGPLSVGAWQDAVRACRTFATNGPWLELEADGKYGLGDTIVFDQVEKVSVVARVVGIGVETLEIVGPDGPMATTEIAPDAEDAALAVDIDVTEPMWLAAVARGGGHPAVLGTKVYAHTSPIWIDVAGRSIARCADAAWCLDWLDRFEALARKVDSFPLQSQLDDLIDVIDRARGFYRSVRAQASE